MGLPTRYGFGIQTKLSFDEAVARIKETLKVEGFGILTEIDVKRTLKEKRDLDFRRYVILGACNPALAERVFAADVDAGLLLPCNVVVYESDGGSVVEVVDPVMRLAVAQDPALDTVGREAKAMLERALAGVPARR